MSKAENRQNEQRIWENRLNKFFKTNPVYTQRNDIKNVSELKDDKVGKRLKDNSNPFYHKNDKYNQELKSLTNKKRRQEGHAQITKELKDMSDDSIKMSINELREKLNVINHNISYVEDYLLTLKEDKKKLEKEICYREFYGEW